MNKKGIISDWPVLLIILFAVIVGFIFLNQIGTQLFNQFITSNIFSGNQDSIDILNRGNSVLKGFDLLIFFVFLSLGVALILTAYFIDTHPIFWGVALIILSLMIMVGALLSNAGNQIVNNPSLNTAYENMPLIIHVLDFYPLFIMVFLFLSGIVFYAKAQVRR